MRTVSILLVVFVTTDPQFGQKRLIGQGGFGQVYLAKRLGRSTLVPDIVFRRRHPWGCPYGAALIDIDRALTLLLS